MNLSNPIYTYGCPYIPNLIAWVKKYYLVKKYLELINFTGYPQILVLQETEKKLSLFLSPPHA